MRSRMSARSGTAPPMERLSIRDLGGALAFAATLLAASACSDDGEAGGLGDGDGPAGADGPSDPVDPYETSAGAGEACAAPAEAYAPTDEGQCEGTAGTVRGTLAGTGSEYCVAAHPACTTAQARCPLVVTANTAGRYFSKVTEPEQWGPLVVVESYGPSDGLAVKDTLAELPRVLMEDYPGIDPEQIFMVGWSAGAGALSRGLCHLGKGADESSYGTTSDLYAAIAVLGGCPSCSEQFAPLAANWHVFATNGIDDQFGGQGCEDSLRSMAQTNGCDRAEEASWRNVEPGDPYVPDADGSAAAQLISFGQCPGGDVLGYRFADEGHVVSYKENFDPKVSAYGMVWSFLQGRRKQGGVTGPAPQCG